jgi:hypothetical protein
MSRGPEHRMAALTLAALLVVGGVMGSINLFVNDVLRDGPQRWMYGATMAACIAAAVPLVVRQRASRWHTLGLVLLGDLIYLVVVYCVDDPVGTPHPSCCCSPRSWPPGSWGAGSSRSTWS